MAFPKVGGRLMVRVGNVPQDAEAAKGAGASLVGAEELVKSIQDGAIDFDRCIATPEVMPLVSRVARVSIFERYHMVIACYTYNTTVSHKMVLLGYQILGPRGLMPNPKMGTVTKDVTAAVKVSK